MVVEPEACAHSAWFSDEEWILWYGGCGSGFVSSMTAVAQEPKVKVPILYHHVHTYKHRGTLLVNRSIWVTSPPSHCSLRHVCHSGTYAEFGTSGFSYVRTKRSLKACVRSARTAPPLFCLSRAQPLPLTILRCGMPMSTILSIHVTSSSISHLGSVSHSLSLRQTHTPYAC